MTEHPSSPIPTGRQRAVWGLAATILALLTVAALVLGATALASSPPGDMETRAVGLGAILSSPLLGLAAEWALRRTRRPMPLAIRLRRSRRAVTWLLGLALIIQVYYISSVAWPPSLIKLWRYRGVLTMLIATATAIGLFGRRPRAAVIVMGVLAVYGSFVSLNMVWTLLVLETGIGPALALSVLMVGLMAAALVGAFARATALWPTSAPHDVKPERSGAT